MHYVIYIYIYCKILYLCCKVFHTSSHNALLIVLKDYVAHHLLVRIMNLMTDLDLAEPKQDMYETKENEYNKYLDLKVTVSQQLFKYKISGAEY